MAQSLTELQKKSDEKRGVKSKGYKLKVQLIDDIAKYSAEFGMSQGDLIEAAVKMFAEHKKGKLD
jgi:hypothetical protein